MVRECAASWRKSIGLIVGLGLFVLSLTLYESWSSRPVFDRWSYAYTVFLAVSSVGFLCVVVACCRSTRWARHFHAGPTHPWLNACLNAAVLCWGIAYAVTALDNPRQAARILELNVIGSTLPAVALLEWAAAMMALMALLIAAASYSPLKGKDWVLTLGALAVTLGVGEGLARTKAVIFPATQGFPTYSAEIWKARHVQLNSMGFRDSERSAAPSEGVTRIVVAGDSYTYGTGLTNPYDRFGDLLSQRMNSENAGRWEVINTGRPDTHTIQHIELLRETIALEPAAVVLLYVFNDIDYLVPVTPRDRVAEPGWSISRSLFLNSYLFQELYVRARKVWLDRVPAQGSSAYGDSGLLAEHISDLGKFVAVAESIGSTVVIVPFDLQTTAEAQLRYSSFVESVADHGLPLCSLEGTFADFPPEALHVNSLDAHPNPLANRLAIDAAFDCISGFLNEGR